MILVGFALVVLTWALALLVVIGAGFLPAVLVSPSSTLRVVVCRALWWGLLVTAIASYAINLREPLRGATSALILLGIASMSVIGGVVARRVRQGPTTASRIANVRSGHTLPGRFRIALIALQAALIAGVLYLAFAALGPVTNYDSGLYHLGAIRYAEDFPTIPGLANIFPALGYGNAEFPLAAMLGNGPLGANGFRVLNGFIMLLLVVDIFLRIHGRRFGTGFFVLVTGVTAAIVPMVALSDYWMTSPSQDSTVMLVTIAATSYFVDAVSRSRSWVGVGATSLSLSIMLVMLRPTMIVFFGATLAALLLVWWRRRRVPAEQSLLIPGLVTVILGILAAIAATARDYVLSGWLQFPLSLHSFNVEWLAPDPVSERLATLGYHRNPDDIWGSIDGWAWVPSWFSRLPSQWETFEFLGLTACAALCLLLVFRVSTRSKVRWKALALALMPSSIALVFWWAATPPSFRFTWGPLFMVPSIVIGWSLARLLRANASGSSTRSAGESAALPSGALLAVSLAMVVTVAFSAATRLNLPSDQETYRFGPFTYALTPPQTPEVAVGTTKAGLAIVQPVQGEQCWTVFPLCTPRLLETVAPRGGSLSDGFLP